MFWRKILMRDTGDILQIGSEVSPQAARVFLRDNWALPARKVYRKLVQAIREDKKLFQACIKLAKEKGYQIY